MEKVAIICPTITDKRELKRAAFAQQYELHWIDYPHQNYSPIMSEQAGFLSYDFDPAETIDYLVAYVKKHNISAVFSTEDYPGTILAAIVAQTCGLRGLNPHSVITHQHKLYARELQKQAIPTHCPSFALLAAGIAVPNGFTFPFFIKPVKCSFSRGAETIYSKEQLQEITQHAQLPDAYLQQINWFISHYTDYQLVPDHVLIEELLHGEQCTIEGFMFNGKITIVGIVDAVMFPGTISFKRFEYPSRLPQEVQEQMAAIAFTLMSASEYGDGFFNIEYMYDAERDHIAVIEVNPRMAFQFADMYEKVDGINTYELMLQLVIGKEITVQRKKGKYAYAASCVLRFFENKRVVAVPSPADLQAIEARFADVRYHLYARPGKFLSDERQDGKSFRYGIITFGGKSITEIEDAFEESKKLLPFTFTPVE